MRALDSRTVQLRAADGRTGAVCVAEVVYDLSKLKPADKIRVDFDVPDARNNKLTAASVWPAE
jgi:NADH:ubiquinone oxidoreductase subunit C